MQWLWRKRAEIAPVKTVYVPVPSFGRWETNWESDTYLREVAAMAESTPFIIEITQLLKEVRELADAAKTPDELTGIRGCISLVRQRLVLSTTAKSQIENMRAKNDIQTNGESDV